MAVLMTVSLVVPVSAASTNSKMSGPADGITVEKHGGRWVATRGGTLALDYTGVAKNAYGWWRVTKGYVDFGFTGVAENENGWWRVEEGKVNFSYTGIANNEYGWWRIVKGKVDFKANGVYPNEYGWWYVKGGKVDFNYNGIGQNSLGYWYIKNGKVDFSKSGSVSYNGTQWTVTGGKAVGANPSRVKTAFSNAGANGSSYQSGHDYCIAVNTSQNIVIVYGKDSSGQFTKPVKAFVASCGLSSTPTKTGTYKTTDKYVWRALNGGVYGQYATRITGSYLFHSVPYYSQSKQRLETAEYNKLGSRASAGCVRLCVRDVKWIYDNYPTGTIVTLYADNNLQEPFVKPSPIRIPTNSPYAGWDPTDPDTRNPWN